MGFNSQLGQVGFARQTAKGSPATLGAAAPARWMKVRQSTVGPDRSLVIPDPEIQGANGRDIPKPYLGPITITGEYDFYVRSEALPLAIYGALGGGGGAPTGSATAGYVHTFTPADTLQYFTLQEEVGNAYETFKYTDLQFNTLHLEVAADGYLMGKTGVTALAQLAGDTPVASPGFDGTPLILGSNCTVTYNAVTLPVSAWSFDFTNNIEDNHYVLGSQFPDGLTPKRREVSGQFTMRPTSSALFRQATYGASAATTPTGNTTLQQMVLTATTYEIIAGATTQVYTVAVTLPEVVLKPFKPSPNQDDTLEVQIDYQAVKSAAANAVSVVVTNGISTAYNL